MIKEFVLQWPVLQQILHGGDGTGPEAMSHRTQTLRPKNEGAKVARSVCPYCAVGCGQLVFHQEGKLVSIEGDPESPISRGAPRRSGKVLRIAGLLEGPAALLVRAFWGASHTGRYAAAVCFLLGSLLSRYAWIWAGRAS